MSSGAASWKKGATSARSEASSGTVKLREFAEELKSQQPVRLVAKSVDLLRAWKHRDHCDFLRTSLKLTSAQPQRIVVYCAGLGDSLPPVSWFLDAVVFVIGAKKAYGLTGMQPDDWHSKAPQLVTGSDFALSRFLEERGSNLWVSGVFPVFSYLSGMKPPSFRVLLPNAHFRPAQTYVESFLAVEMALLFVWVAHEFPSMKKDVLLIGESAGTQTMVSVPAMVAKSEFTIKRMVVSAPAMSTLRLSMLLQWSETHTVFLVHSEDKLCPVPAQCNEAWRAVEETGAKVVHLKLKCDHMNTAKFGHSRHTLLKPVIELDHFRAWLVGGQWTDIGPNFDLLSMAELVVIFNASLLLSRIRDPRNDFSRVQVPPTQSKQDLNFIGDYCLRMLEANSACLDPMANASQQGDMRTFFEDFRQQLTGVGSHSTADILAVRQEYSVFMLWTVIKWNRTHAWSQNGGVSKIQFGGR